MAIKNLTDIKLHLFMCNGGACCNLGAQEATDIIRNTIKKLGFFDAVHTTKTFCNGRCNQAPIVIEIPKGNWYKNISPQYAEEFATRLVNNKPIPNKHKLYTYGNASINYETLESNTNQKTS
ncbi:MAG: (2Fe-2S) ferredoxin domain-containing protein [Sphingobacteriales bacterium]|nr:MAG: (2Fe-2S) ferredoxin domain-containing protein [Sphingobacteriales bacterium]